MYRCVLATTMCRQSIRRVPCWRGVTPIAVWACFIWGVGLTVINMLLGNPINPINCGAIAMVGGFPVVFLVSLFTKKLPISDVDYMFQCYKK